MFMIFSRKRRNVLLDKLIRRWLPCMIVTAVAFVVGCSSARPPATDVVTGQPSSSAVNQINESLSMIASQSRSSTADYRIGPEDLVQITLYNIPDQDARVTPRQVILRVSQDGMIVLPLIGAVAATGKTISQLQEELGKKYEKYIRNPNVGVLVTEYHQRVSVMGAVQKPGVFELTSPKTVIDMIAMAGGVNAMAGNQVMLYRQQPNGGRETAVIDLLVLANQVGQVTDAKDSAMVNMPVQAGDVINVPQAGMYFVDGAVRKPGSYPMGRSYTLTQALATAGGVDPELADYSAISIYRRRGPTNVETINVDLDDILARKSEDLQVRPDDVILVPMSGMKYFVKRFVGQLFSLGGPPIH
jgi:polysaccharide biosynthesis/export protein